MTDWLTATVCCFGMILFQYWFQRSPRYNRSLKVQFAYHRKLSLRRKQTFEGYARGVRRSMRLGIAILWIFGLMSLFAVVRDLV